MIAWLKRTGPVQRAGVVLVVVAVLTLILGTIDEYGGLPIGQVIQHVFRDFYANLSTELGSIALTVLIIDSLTRRYKEQTEEHREKTRLIREMGNRDKSVALQAVEELRLNHWLEDGTLDHLHITWGNLEGAVLNRANLRGAHLWLTNLRRAHLYDTNLQGAFMQAVDLQDAHLCGTNLAGANLTDSNLLNANLDDATILDNETILPDCTYWTPGTDMGRFTDPLHSDFWRSKHPHSPAYRAEDDSE
jgi:hypothetical protein